ncbi:MAG TPA: S53 family peptidase, partial [Steroidobacteraceae bacterium]
ENRVFYSPDREPAIALDVPVRHLSGLNDFSRPHPGAGPGPALAPLPRGGTLDGHGRGVRPASEGGGSGPPSPYGGYSWLSSDMRRAYNMGPNTGTGQVVALMEFAGYNSADIRKYFSSVGQVNRVPITNIVVGGGSATTWNNVNNNGEVCLDIEQVLGVAPGLKELRVYIGGEQFGSGVDILLLNRIANDNVAKQVNNSWYWFPDDPAQDDPVFQQMAVQGQTFVSASGDEGAYTGNDGTDGSYPGEDLHVLAVGATSLTTSGPPNQYWQSEVVWNRFGAGSGGGPANDGMTFPIPTWQAAVVNASNRGSTLVRNTPDVAMEGDYFNYIVYNNGVQAANWGGTSFAAPRWTAYLALVNQQLVSQGKRGGLGLINPTLYAIGRGARYNTDFHDC